MELSLTVNKQKEALQARIHVGLITSHPLAGKYLRDMIVRLGIDPAPWILSDKTLDSVSFPGDVRFAIVVDLYGLSLPVCTYVDAFSKLQDRCAFLALDRQKSPEDIAHLLLAGFSGFISHDEVPSSLALAINAVGRNLTWVPPEAMHIYMTLTSQRLINGIEMLTKRENQMLELMRKRHSNKEMSAFLGISESTVKFHVANVMAKLNMSDRRDLNESTLVRQASVVLVQIAKHLKLA
jgi:DNA-binding NarL/FixJ family response regulator